VAVDVAVDVALMPGAQRQLRVRLCNNSRRAVVVDPAVGAGGDSAWLRQRGLELEAVLQTITTAIHIGGNPGAAGRMAGAAGDRRRADRERIPFQPAPIAQRGEELHLARSHHQGAWAVPATPALTWPMSLPARARR